MIDPKQALGEAARQRGAMAARVRLPWWYLALVAVSWTLLMGDGLPTARDFYQGAGISKFPYAYVGAFVLLPMLVLFRRWSGLHLVERSTAYPALKRHALGTVLVFGGSFLVELALFLMDDRWSGAPRAAVAVAVISGCLAAVQLYRVNAGIRRDIADGW
ncbi:hypothetical protein GCM10011609_87580 [Lentzea pudingi]|uniref:Uncharacterized protein n=1 Tax=Lentzea pudingi TaxID=1789439 RepID=A0ABQ2ITF7_9PSEU|nr:hypothetical protein [Lentzea pudingi]GGN30050.1 hypothetical protein GCM10011609_87580 [Lentzea pudingi]